MVTPHWITDKVTVTSGTSHPLYFDYGGFPAETYKYQYNAPGSPSLASKVCTLLRNEKIPCGEDAKRGWDHGVFVPLMLMYPDASIPVVAMSLVKSLDPAEHIRIGKALAPLREQGVLIVGSGASFHNFDYFFARNENKRMEGVRHSHTWHNFLVETLTSDQVSLEEKYSKLTEWTKAPSAIACQPLNGEDHLIPLHVVAGAGGNSVCRFVGEPPLANEIAMANFEWK